MIPIPRLDTPTSPEAVERARRAKERANRARAQIRPMIQTKGHRPKIDLPPHLREPARCAGCDGKMAVIEPGQIYHPGCHPEPA